MIQCSLWVLTCRREGAETDWPYVGRTIAQINREDFRGRRVLMIDGNGEDAAPDLPFDTAGWEVQTFGAPHLRGNKFVYWEIFRRAAVEGGDVLILEDDVELCRNAVRRMSMFEIPRDLQLVQFFSPQILQTRQMPPGLWRPPIAQFMFAQAIKYTAETVRRLVDWGSQRDWQMFNASDDAVQHAVKRLGLRYGVHAPDLVQHVGEISQANPRDTLVDFRLSKMWPGPDFDALSLYSRDDLFK